MHSLTVGAALVAFAGACFLSLLQYLRSSTKTSKVNQDDEIPGPKQLPVIGRIHDLPIQYMWLKFKEWADIYGPIYQTSMLGTKFIVVSDEKIAEELLVKKARVFSDRPGVMSLFDSKSTHGSMEYLPLMGKNQYWSRQRRWTHASLTEEANANYHDIVDYEVKRWMHRLLHNPDQFSFSLEDMASKITCTLTWDDHTLSEYNSKSAWGLLTQMSPAGPITNLITPLWRLPLYINPWKLAEHKRHDEQQAWWMKQLQRVRRGMEDGTQRRCWTRNALENFKRTNLSGDYEASSVIGMLALVGVFTISGPLHYFLMAMVLFPEWQEKCQEEVDRVCGGGRLPSLADYKDLPVLRACIKETMRWRPNVPTGVAHEAEEDDVYRGYVIEKGTRILPLDWAFLRNTTKYPRPTEFLPQRWLESTYPTYQEPLSQYPTIVGMTSFGWGRRACLGQQLTQDELLVSCGSVLSCFDMRPKINPKTGREIPIDANKSNSLLIIRPDPWDMVFVPRSEKKREFVEREWREAEEADRREREEFLKTTRETNGWSEGMVALEKRDEIISLEQKTEEVNEKVDSATGSTEKLVDVEA